MFTQQHFNALAEDIAGSVKVARDPSSVNWAPADVLLYLADVLADRFERDNPSFKRNKFLKACGVVAETKAAP